MLIYEMQQLNVSISNIAGFYGHLSGKERRNMEDQNELQSAVLFPLFFKCISYPYASQHPKRF